MNNDLAKLMITEEDFTDFAKNTLEPWIENDFTKGHFTSFDGTKIAYYYNINPDEKASIVISHGMGEFFVKYYEIAYIFYHMGYSVFFIEHRGFGFSDRAVPELDHIYVESYNEYVEDFRQNMEQIVKPNAKTDNYILFAHSMGGAIGTLFLEKYSNYFKCAVLSSPMHRMVLGKFKPWQVKLICSTMTAIGKGNNIVPGQREFDGINIWEKSSSVSKTRYDFQFNKRLEVPEYTTYGGTHAWTIASIKATDRLLKNASYVTTPVLLCEAGRDRLVDNEGHRIFIERTGDYVTYKIFPEAKHEIFNGDEKTREEYWTCVFDYIDSQLKE